MTQAGDRRSADLAATYRRVAPDASPTEVVDALTAAYCPAVAASSALRYHKFAEMRRSAREAEAVAATPAGGAPFPEVDIIWATPLGHSLPGAPVIRRQAHLPGR